MELVFGLAGKKREKRLEKEKLNYLEACGENANFFFPFRHLPELVLNYL